MRAYQIILLFFVLVVQQSIQDPVTNVRSSKRGAYQLTYEEIEQLAQQLFNEIKHGKAGQHVNIGEPQGQYGNSQQQQGQYGNVGQSQEQYGNVGQAEWRYGNSDHSEEQYGNVGHQVQYRDQKQHEQSGVISGYSSQNYHQSSEENRYNNDYSQGQIDGNPSDSSHSGKRTTSSDDDNNAGEYNSNNRQRSVSERSEQWQRQGENQMAVDQDVDDENNHYQGHRARSPIIWNIKRSSYSSDDNDDDDDQQHHQQSNHQQGLRARSFNSWPNTQQQESEQNQQQIAGKSWLYSISSSNPLSFQAHYERAQERLQKLVSLNQISHAQAQVVLQMIRNQARNALNKFNPFANWGHHENQQPVSNEIQRTLSRFAVPSIFNPAGNATPQSGAQNQQQQHELSEQNVGLLNAFNPLVALTTPPPPVQH